MTDQDGGRSPSSTIAASEMDDHRTAASSPNRADPRTSLQHVLGDTDSVQNTPPRKRGLGEITEDEELKPAPSTAKSKSGPKGRKGASAAKDTNPASSYTGHKVRHLKKDDGEPLWRADIQYDFLKMIFDDGTKVFTNSYEPGEQQTFADLYIDAMARSSKTSKILRDKLLSEHEPAKNMAMVCLLVNLGRMNTTLNCKNL
jgi:Ino eighty subunit 1